MNRAAKIGSLGIMDCIQAECETAYDKTGLVRHLISEAIFAWAFNYDQTSLSSWYSGCEHANL